MESGAPNSTRCLCEPGYFHGADFYRKGSAMRQLLTSEGKHRAPRLLQPVGAYHAWGDSFTLRFEQLDVQALYEWYQDQQRLRRLRCCRRRCHHCGALGAPAALSTIRTAHARRVPPSSRFAAATGRLWTASC